MGLLEAHANLAGKVAVAPAAPAASRDAP